MTNLQRYDNSAVRAFEAFDKLTIPTKSFAVWCDSPVERKLPKWLVPGQWVQHTTQSVCFLINHVSENYVYFEDHGKCSLKHFSDPDPNYIPVTIKPWSFDEARAAMDSDVLLWIRRQYSDISGVTAHKDGTTSICLSNGTSYRTSNIPEGVTISNHQPCGTPVPM